MKKVCILVLILRGLIVDITVVILMFSEMHVFRTGVFLFFFRKHRGEKRGQRQIQGAQNSGNPCAKSTTLVFYIVQRLSAF